MCIFHCIMEEETRLFLVRIANTLSLVLLWMMANVFAGFYFELAFYGSAQPYAHLIYYALSAISFVFLLLHLKKKWNL